MLAERRCSPTSHLQTQDMMLSTTKENGQTGARPMAIRRPLMESGCFLLAKVSPWCSARVHTSVPEDEDCSVSVSVAMPVEHFFDGKLLFSYSMEKASHKERGPCQTTFSCVWGCRLSREVPRLFFGGLIPKTLARPTPLSHEATPPYRGGRWRFSPAAVREESQYLVPDGVFVSINSRDCHHGRKHW